MGFDASDFASDVECFEIWPNNRLPFNLFLLLRNSWLIGPKGPTGIPASEILAVCKTFGITGSKRRKVFVDIQTMIDETLRVTYSGS